MWWFKYAVAVRLSEYDSTLIPNCCFRKLCTARKAAFSLRILMWHCASVKLHLLSFHCSWHPYPSMKLWTLLLLLLPSGQYVNSDTVCPTKSSLSVGWSLPSVTVSSSIYSNVEGHDNVMGLVATKSWERVFKAIVLLWVALILAVGRATTMVLVFRLNPRNSSWVPENPRQEKSHRTVESVTSVFVTTEACHLGRW